MRLLLLPWLFLVAASTFYTTQSREVDNDSFEIDDVMHGHNRRTTTTVSPAKSFVCPATYGRYPHEKDCGLYYECRFGYPHLMKCDRNKLYDDKKEKCNDKRRVDCNREDRGKDRDHDQDEKELDHDEDFQCPYIWGTFPHPTTCFKYYVCAYNIPSLFQCYGSTLFDSRSRKCLDKRRVKCGDRLDRDDMKTSKRPTTKSPSTSPQPQKSTTIAEVSTAEGNRRFACPFVNGRYPDPQDCSQFYECRFAIPTLHKCPPATLYDERREECLEDTHVRCGDRPGGVGGDNDTKEEKKEKLSCPYIWGTFPHPDDCSKYIICIYNVPTVFSCTKSNLFHAKYRRCIPKEKVTCDYRINPDDFTRPDRSTRAITSTMTNTIVTTTSTRIITTTSSPFPTTTTAAPTTTTAAPTTTTAAPTTTTAAPTTTTAAPTTTTAAPTTTTAAPTTTTAAPTTTTAAPTTTTAAPTTTTAAPTTTTAVDPTTTTTVAPTTTTTAAPATTTTAAPITTTTAAATTTTVSPTTTEVPITKVTKPNTPPPTDCEEGDLDCIIDETGDVKGWFDCPERYGHFAHGSSHQLFIHCDNYRPFVKKCADNTVFSPKYLVCMWLEEQTRK